MSHRSCTLRCVSDVCVAHSIGNGEAMTISRQDHASFAEMYQHLMSEMWEDVRRLQALLNLAVMHDDAATVSTSAIALLACHAALHRVAHRVAMHNRCARTQSSNAMFAAAVIPN